MKKSELRKIAISKRKSLTPEKSRRISEQIIERIEESFDFNSKAVNLFLPIKKFNEIDLFPLIDIVKKQGGYPCINKTDFSSRKMTSYLFEGKDQLELSAFDIPEPVSGTVVTQDQIDLVFVPMLSFDHSGHRVGYGKGFYDNFLTGCRKDCVFVGVNHFDEIIEIDDVTTKDIPMHFVVSPQRLHSF